MSEYGVIEILKLGAERIGYIDDAYSLTFFSPLSDSYSDINNYSPIMLLEYRG